MTFRTLPKSLLISEKFKFTSFSRFLGAIFLFFLLIPKINCKPKILTGVDHLSQTNFSILQGKRVGLLTHPAGRNRFGHSTVKVLRTAGNLELLSLFGPEHGIYGDEKAAVLVDDKIDQKTGLPVYSLYGKYRKPTPGMLRGIDSLVIDLQDVGVRCYTYVSCMRYAMEACFEQGVEVVVLDRPNPLGGLKIAGPMMDEECMSYVGAFPMPFVHGMTIAELALWAKKTPGILKISESIRKKGKLTIVPMKGWNRSMSWPQTGLRWYPTSPNIPTLDSVAGYPMTGLGAQMGKFKHGIGTPHPFRLLTFEGMKSTDLKRELDSLNMAGLDFRLKTVSNEKGQKVEGVYVVIRDWSSWKPTELAFYMMQLSAKWEKPSPFVKAVKSEITLFNKHVGSMSWWNHLHTAGSSVNPRPYLRRWDADVKKFRSKIRSYLLY